MDVPSNLTVDEIDDVIYLVRVDEAEELDQTLQALSQHYSITPGAILQQAIAPGGENTVLHYASANGLEDMTSTILKAIPDADRVAFVNRANRNGNTPLHWAALNGHLPVVKQLLDAGANMWIKNAVGHLALFEAERGEKNDVVQFLLQAGGKDVERAGKEAEEDGDIVGEASGTTNGS